MKVAFVVEHFHPHIGGAEKLFGDLATSLVQSGVEVRVVTSDSGGVRGPRIDGGVAIFHHRWPSLFDHPIALRKDLSEHVRWADLVQTTQYTAAPAAIAVAHRLGKPCVFMAYEFLGERWQLVVGGLRGRAFQGFERWVFAKPYDWLVALSKATARDLAVAGIGRGRISTIYPVFNDFTFWRGQGQSPDSTFLYYGRPGKTKGVFLLLDAIRVLDPRLPPQWRFEFILSDEPAGDRRAFLTSVEQSGLSSRVVTSRPLPPEQLRARLDNAYCVIVPSLTEGFGYSAYQAVCMGKHVIASTAGSLPEVVSGSFLLFESGSVEALADAIVKATEGQFQHAPARISNDGTDRTIDLYRNVLMAGPAW